MDFNIITGYPSWYILLCILIGVLAAMVLYYREKKNEFPAWLKRLLGVNRFLLVSIIAFLLLTPLLKLISRSAEKPIIVFAQDNSLSLVLGADSAYYRNEYLPSLNAVLDKLREDYEVRMFTFGENVNPVGTDHFDSLGFDEKQSDISALFDMMDVRFVNRNTGALIIASDGIYNKGMNPIYHSSDIECPIYTLALGDTAVRKDAYIKRVQYNRIAYQGNDFPVEIIVNANKLSGATLSLSLSEGKQVLINRQLAIDGQNYSKTLRLNITAGDPGNHHYVLRISSNEEELSKENNRFDLFVDVLQSKQKILILANSPHPDITAIKDAISSNINYLVDDKLIDDFNGPLEEYSLIILHQLPSRSAASARILSSLNRAKIPLLYIFGSQTDLNIFNGQRTGLLVNIVNNTLMNEVTPVLNEDFSTFNISEELAALVPFLPPLNTHFARYELSNSTGVLFYQKNGNIESQNPLWLFNQGRDVKTAAITGTGLWKWRMKCWLETGNHDLFNEIINKSIQYLALKEDKRKFRVISPESIAENEAFEVSAELYNDSFEAFNEPDVGIKITDDEGDAYDFVFSRTEEAYTLNAGTFPVGTYTYEASVRVGDQVLTDAGGFSVLPVIAEQVSLRASHDLLEELARKNDGLLITPENLDSLPEIIKARGDVKPIIHSEKKFIEFIDIWWILIIILTLLSLEWFLRKWSGSY